MYRSILQVAILVLLSVCAQAQTLRFTVLEKESRQPVELAFVNVYELPNNAIQNTVQTDVNGIADVRPEKYPCRVEIALQGYEKYSKEFLTPPINTMPTIMLTKKFSSLNEVVVTGVAQPVRMKDALSSYRVIPRAMIQAQGAVTLDDALKTQLNINIAGDPLLGSSMRMQGLSGDKIKILIDGMPVNGREAGNINLGQINMNNVERIEVVQGPMGVAYGADALGGVVNIITRREHKKFGVRLNGYYESVGKYNGDGSITYQLKNRHQFTVGGGRNFFGGYENIDVPISYRNTTLITERCFYFKPNEQYIGNFAYSYTAPSQFKINFASDFLKEKTTNKGDARAFDPFQGSYAFDEYYYTTRSQNRLSLQGKAGKKGNWQMQNNYALYYRIRKNVKTDLTTMQETFLPSLTQDTTRFQDITSRGTYSNNVGLLNYSVGYDVNMEYARSLKVAGFDKTIQDYALFTTLSYAVIKDRLTAQAGLRGSYNTTYNTPAIPSVNLLYTPAKNVQIRGSYAKGYRAPALKEMYLSFIDNNHYIIGSPNLTAEKSNHVQLSGSYQVYEKNADYVQVMLTGFFNDVYNGISLVPLDPTDPNSIRYTYGNLSRQQNTVGNLQVDGQYSNFHWQVGYSHNFTFAQEGLNDAYNFGEATATVQYAWKKTGLNFNAFYKYNGKQPNISNGVTGATINGSRDAYSMLDGSVEKKFLNQKVQIIAGVKNILNVRRLPVTGIMTSTAHSGTGGVIFMPRSLYTSVNLNID